MRTLIVGASIAGYYSISAWSQVLVWPASQAPYCKSNMRNFFRVMTKSILDKYGWQSAISLAVLVVILTVGLRIVDVRYLMYGSNTPYYLYQMLINLQAQEKERGTRARRRGSQ